MDLGILGWVVLVCPGGVLARGLVWEVAGIMGKVSDMVAGDGEACIMVEHMWGDQWLGMGMALALWSCTVAVFAQGWFSEVLGTVAQVRGMVGLDVVACILMEQVEGHG